MAGRVSTAARNSTVIVVSRMVCHMYCRKGMLYLGSFLRHANYGVRLEEGRIIKASADSVWVELGSFLT